LLSDQLQPSTPQKENDEDDQVIIIQKNKTKSKTIASLLKPGHEGEDGLFLADGIWLTWTEKLPVIHNFPKKKNPVVMKKQPSKEPIIIDLEEDSEKNQNKNPWDSPPPEKPKPIKSLDVECSKLKKLVKEKMRIVSNLMRISKIH